MITAEGEVVTMFVVQSDGAKYEVVTPEFFGDAVFLSTAHVIRRCDEGKLIAYKIRGMWWIRKNEIGQTRMT